MIHTPFADLITFDRMGKATLAGAGVDDEVEDSKQGRRMTKVMKVLERMARVVLDLEIRLARWPTKVADVD